MHLDYYYHQQDRNYLHDKDAWVTRVKALIAKDEWVMDGNYRSTFEERFSRADLIIFLDYKWNVYLQGVFRRRVSHRKKQRIDMPDTWKEKINWEFFLYVLQFHKRERHKLTDAVGYLPPKKLIVLHTRKEADAYLKEL